MLQQCCSVNTHDMRCPGQSDSCCSSKGTPLRWNRTTEPPCSYGFEARTQHQLRSVRQMLQQCCSVNTHEMRCAGQSESCCSSKGTPLRWNRTTEPPGSYGFEARTQHQLRSVRQMLKQCCSVNNHEMRCPGQSESCCSSKGTPLRWNRTTEPPGSYGFEARTQHQLRSVRQMLQCGQGQDTAAADSSCRDRDGTAGGTNSGLLTASDPFVAVQLRQTRQASRWRVKNRCWQMSEQRGRFQLRC
jgi:hypothetical protein